jgi:hypothetical protein
MAWTTLRRIPARGPRRVPAGTGCRAMRISAEYGTRRRENCRSCGIARRPASMNRAIARRRNPAGNRVGAIPPYAEPGPAEIPRRVRRGGRKPKMKGSIPRAMRCHRHRPGSAKGSGPRLAATHPPESPTPCAKPTAARPASGSAQPEWPAAHPAARKRCGEHGSGSRPLVDDQPLLTMTGSRGGQSTQFGGTNRCTLILYG